MMRGVATALLAAGSMCCLPGLTVAAEVQAHKDVPKTQQKKTPKPAQKQPVKKPPPKQAAKAAPRQPAKQAATRQTARLAPEQIFRPAVATDENTDGFLNLYVELCVRHFGELEDFRARLLKDKVPKLKDEDAKLFLSGMAGDAWPVPYKGKMGNYVLVLPAGKNLCLLHAHRANAAAVEKGFIDIVADAPEPMVAQRRPDREELSADKIKMRTVSSTWAPPGSRRRMEFMLTTTESDKAELQALGSVAMINSETESPVPAPQPRARP